MRLVDSHAHLQGDRFAGDVELVIGGARLAGVERMLVPGWNVDSSRDALALADRFPWLDVAVGVHPHDAANVDDAAWAEIVRMAADPRVVAIGETGLDFDRVFSPPDSQLANLRRNLALAAETGKPAILHCRSADGQRDAQDALLVELAAARFEVGAIASFGARPPAIIHSYSGPVDYARVVIERGLTRVVQRPRLPAWRGGQRGGGAPRSTGSPPRGDRLSIPAAAGSTAQAQRAGVGAGDGRLARGAARPRGGSLGAALVASYEAAFGHVDSPRAERFVHRRRRSGQMTVTTAPGGC